jgi:hypothetical protein
MYIPLFLFLFHPRPRWSILALATDDQEHVLCRASRQLNNEPCDALCFFPLAVAIYNTSFTSQYQCTACPYFSLTICWINWKRWTSSNVFLFVKRSSKSTSNYFLSSSIRPSIAAHQWGCGCIFFFWCAVALVQQLVYPLSLLLSHLAPSFRIRIGALMRMV